MQKEMENMIVEAVRKELGSGYDVFLKEQTKNNCTVYQGVGIREHGMENYPVVHIDEIVWGLRSGEITMEDAARKIVRHYMDHREESARYSGIAENLGKDGILERVVYLVVNAERNAEQLSIMPHRKFLDLAVLYRVEVERLEGAVVGFTLRSAMCERYGISAAELETTARRNTEAKGFRTWTMAQVLSEFGGITDVPDSYPMYIISHPDRINGSAAMLYADHFEELSEKLGDDLYVLPSSIHEVIAVPVEDNEPGVFKTIVGEVNDSQVKEDEYLSGSVYRYNRGSGELVIA